MGLWGRLRARRRYTAGRGRDDLDYLRGWATARRGVEVYLEPATMVTDTTVVLVAHDGEWTRRGVPNAAAARRLARSLRIPMYDVLKLGYPKRMREYTARQRVLRERARRRALGDSS